MKNLKFLFAGVACAAIMISCGKENGGGGIINPPSDDTTGVVEIEIPGIDAPAAGQTTIAIYVPEGTCNGVIAVGASMGADGADDWTPADKKNPFTALEGHDRWYTITVPYYPAIGAKAIAVNDAGVADWGTQWGMNKEGEDANVVILSGEGVLDNSENGGEVKLTSLVDGAVVYVQIKAWKSEPCTPKNKAGKASFELTSEVALADSIKVGVIGNFVTDWTITEAIELTKGEDGVYRVADVEVPASCQYKYVLKVGQAGWSWDTSENGDNRDMPLDLKAVDTVKEWKGLPTETPAE